MMKKSLLIFILFSLQFSLWAKAPKIKIVASASMFYDMASNLITEDFEIETIVPIGSDPHKYKAKPSDARLIQKADLILVNGLTFEGWINEVIENSGTKAKIITITEGITPITSQQYKNSSDPHAWMTAANGLIYIKNIKDALINLRPDSKQKIEENYLIYEAKLKALDEELMSLIKTIPEAQRVLITSHDAFQYYGQHYGLRLEAIMGISTEAAAQTSDIERVSKAIKAYNVPAVFIESTINPKMLKQIAEDNNVAVGGQLYADSLGDEISPAPTYIEMLRYNTKTIASALTKSVAEIKANNKEMEKSSPPSLTDGLSKANKILLASILLLAMLAVIVYKIKQR